MENTRIKKPTLHKQCRLVKNRDDINYLSHQTFPTSLSPPGTAADAAL